MMRQNVHGAAVRMTGLLIHFFFFSYSHSKLPLYVTARVEYFFTGLDNCISTWFNTNNYLYNVPSRN